jgi:putative aminopeptidase FrvX
MKLRFLEIAERVIPCPTAPYHERFVQNAVREIAAEFDLKLRSDTFGNIYLESGHEGRPIVLAAHMDHPGFEIVSSNPEAWIAKFLGGVPENYFKAGMSLRLHPGNKQARLGAKEGQNFLIHSEEELSMQPEFAVWDLPDFLLEEGLLHARVCDDLVGVATIISVLGALREENHTGKVIGLISRAEEVGFHGALFAAKSGEIPRDSLVISLETSRELAPVQMGAGVIIRVGDRASVFNDEATRFLAETAQLSAAEETTFKFQRALMSGGTCEATAFQHYGFQTAALCVALGNYHNCGPAEQIAPEYVNVSDVENMILLLTNAARRMSDFSELTSKLKSRLHHIEKEIRTT